MGEGTDPVTDFLTGEEKEAQKKLAILDDQAHEGALFTDWSRSYCSKRLFKWLDEQIQDSKNAWLAAIDRDKAEAIRLQAQAFTRTKNWVLAQVKAGELASEGIKKFHEEGIELEGLIRPPTDK